MDKQLRVMAANVVVESKLSKAAKLQMLNFIKEDATDAQIKALLMDGKIVKLDEQAEQIVNERFAANTNISKLLEAGTVMGVLGMLTGVLPIWRGLAAVFSDAHRQCGVIKISKDRDACMAKARMNYASKKIAVLKKALGKCGTIANPDKCKKMIVAHIAKEESALAQQKDKLQKLTMAGRSSGEGPSKFVTARM